MNKYTKIIDDQKPVIQNYFFIVFFRGERVKDKVSLIRWVWFCFVEILFGEEILESLAMTSSVSGCPEDEDTRRKYGKPQQLNFHIPSGLFTNKFRTQLIQVLYYKYYLQYLFLQPISEPTENKKTNTIDVTRKRFRLNKGMLYLFIAFRRVYLLSSLVFNLLVDAVVFIISNSLESAIISAIIVETLRRIMKL